jgi:hypothetical protein
MNESAVEMVSQPNIKYLMYSEKVRKTTSNKILYVGGAIWEGQDIKGVELTPNILRSANLFKTLE